MFPHGGNIVVPHGEITVVPNVGNSLVPHGGNIVDTHGENIFVVCHPPPKLLLILVKTKHCKFGQTGHICAW